MRKATVFYYIRINLLVRVSKTKLETINVKRDMKREILV